MNSRNTYKQYLTNPAVVAFLFFATGLLSSIVLAVFHLINFGEENLLTFAAIYCLIPILLSGLGYFIGMEIKKFNSYKSNWVLEQKKELNKLGNFARNIGTQKNEAINEEVFDSVLGQTLLNLNEKLIHEQETDKNRQWIHDGKEKVNQAILENDDLKELTYEIVAAITAYLNLPYGALYIKDENYGTVKLNRIACFAYDRRKHDSKSIDSKEGFIGQTVQEKHYLMKSSVPQDYIEYTTGLSDMPNPGELIIIPLMNEDVVLGVLEILSYSPYTENQVHFLTEICSDISHPLYTRLNNEHTKKLLVESTKLTEELRSQQMQLEENAVEMREKQEQIEITNKKLEDQISEVKNIQSRQHVLLENASELITVYDGNQSIRYVSPSIKNILGFEDHELIGKKDTDNFDFEGLEKLNEMFEVLLNDPHEQFTFQYSYKKKNGHTIWLEATGRNFLHHPAIKGIVLNSRDITQKRLAEKEQIMRGKMQSLSENSQDLIIRFDLNANFLYVNPMVKSYTGYAKEFYKNKNLRMIDMSDTVTNDILDIMKAVKQQLVTQSREMKFEAENMSSRMLQVNAIPEFDAENNLETILLVLHDITEMKEKENIIQKTNQKIKESINYSRRIQNAIIPMTEEIKKDLKDLFIFYKSKDVVSGDFPWYYKKDNLIYIAAVDCTGHGVPGAMMSLIGHLLLNDITNGEVDLSPAEILDNLHKKVVSTLQQDKAGTNTSDGMDIALMQIDMDTQKIQFSGAHRPLYYIQDGNLLQVKGDRFPIGGMQYKGKNEYTNHEINYSKGDSFFVFSDGYTDQFGGDKNSKYGLKRLRNLIQENSMFSMNEMQNIIEEDFTTWMGDNKQMDDIIFIGFKF